MTKIQNLKFKNSCEAPYECIHDLRGVKGFTDTITTKDDGRLRHDSKSAVQ